MKELSSRLFDIFSCPDFLSTKGLANEVPLFIQPYDSSKEDTLRRLLDSLEVRLRNTGVGVKRIDLFNLVLDELEESQLLEAIIQQEAEFKKIEVLETLQNFSDPKSRLIPRLIREIGDESTQLVLITGSGRIYPFLRTHSILESLQPAMLSHPIVIFFPGEYVQYPEGGSDLSLFGAHPQPRINQAYYRATNLNHYRL